MVTRLLAPLVAALDEPKLVEDPTGPVSVVVDWAATEVADAYLRVCGVTVLSACVGLKRENANRRLTRN